MGDSENRPVEKSNADIINEVCLPVMPLAMLRFEQITNFVTEEPLHIRVRLNQGDRLRDFEQILRLRTWVPNQETNSWCIYSEVREWVREEGNIGGLVIRNSVWDRYTDMRKLINAKSEDQDEHLRAWPAVRLRTFYFSEENSFELVRNLKTLDLALENGIKLIKREKSVEVSDWIEIDCMRRFDWGQVQATWTPDMVNKEIESLRIGIIDQLEKLLEAVLNKVYQIQLNYSVPLDIWKSMTIGE